MAMGDIPPSSSSLVGETSKTVSTNGYTGNSVTVLPASIPVGVMGIGVSFPEHTITAEDFEKYALQHYPPTPAMKKTLAINRSTLIRQRPVLLPLTHPHLSGPSPQPVEAALPLFLTHCVPLAASAARKAISDWGGRVEDITHLVCVTVVVSSNPGWDLHLASSLRLSPSVQRTLLHGVGCTGGLALLRTAAQLALAAEVIGQKANVLCVGGEMASLYYRGALEDVHVKQEVGPGLTLFGDGAAAFVVSTCAPVSGGSDSASSNDQHSETAFPNSTTSTPPPKKPIYTLLAYTSATLPDSTQDLAVSLSSTGYNASLSRTVPALTASAVLPLLGSLQSALGTSLQPGEMDWALHPGGAAIVKSVQKAAEVPEERLRASWDVYTQRGNVASGTVWAVLQCMRGWEVRAKQEGGGEGEGRKHVLAIAFGPGVSVEMMMLQRA